MALVIKKWFPCKNERAVLEHLQNLYVNVERDVYLLHDVLLASKEGVCFRPDFILIDPLYGISIIEEKSYLPHNLKSLDQTDVVFHNNQSDVSPLKKGEDYRHNLANLLSTERIEISNRSIKCHIVFTNLPENFISIASPVVEKHYRNFRDTLSFQSLFPGIKLSTSKVSQICKILNPVQCFTYAQDNFDAHTSSIAELDEQQMEAVRQNTDGHYLVSGIPGSGKSVIIVSRALYLQELNPDWKILILSVNDKLKSKNYFQITERTKIRKSIGLDNNIVCRTLMGFLKENSSADVKYLTYPQKISKYIADISSREAIPKWDAILIDEYQDFEDDCLKLIMTFAKKKEMTINKKEVIRENFFLVGDKLQQIWEKGCSQTWISLGIHITGRTINLKTSYRCGKEALEMGLGFLKSCSSSLEAQVDGFYKGTDDIHYHSEEGHPITFSRSAGGDAEFELGKWILSLVSQGAKYSDIIVIVPDSKVILESISHRFSKEVSLGLTVGMPSTIKGLEAPFCAIFNIDYIKPIKWNSKEVRYRTLYMCLTRASYGLYINSSVEYDEVFLKLKELEKAIRQKKTA